MKSADVQSVFYNAHPNNIMKHKLIDIGASGSCRIFSVVWCPYQIDPNFKPVVSLWEGDPDSGGTKLYEDGCYVSASTDGTSTEISQPFLSFEPFPSHYYLFNDDVWVKGGTSSGGYGIKNVTVTYQLGG